MSLILWITYFGWCDVLLRCISIISDQRSLVLVGLPGFSFGIPRSLTLLIAPFLDNRQGNGSWVPLSLFPLFHELLLPLNYRFGFLLHPFCNCIDLIDYRHEFLAVLFMLVPINNAMELSTNWQNVIRNFPEHSLVSADLKPPRIARSRYRALKHPKIDARVLRMKLLRNL